MAVLGLAWDSLQVLILHIFFKVIFRCVQAFSSCGEQGLFSLRGKSLACQWLLLLWSTDSRAQAQGSLVARRHVESSWTRDQTHVPCTGRWTLRHWTTRGVRFGIFSMTRSLCSWLLAAGAVGSVQGHSYQPSCEQGTPCV